MHLVLSDLFSVPYDAFPRLLWYILSYERVENGVRSDLQSHDDEQQENQNRHNARPRYPTPERVTVESIT